MNWSQEIIVGIIVIIAIGFAMKVVLEQILKPKVDPKCKNCPAPDLKKKLK